jgi:hypothetical protein
MSELVVWYEIEFGGRLLNPPPYTVTFYREIGVHTVVDVRALYPDSMPIKQRPPMPEHGTLAKVKWGTKPSAMREWFGYVHHSRPDYDHPEPGSQAVRYVLVGTGHALEAEYTKDWRNITDSGMAQEIAKKYNLSLVAHKTTRVYEYLLQPGVSDLEWLRLRGRECGRIVHVENGVLFFVDPSSLAMAKQAAPFEIVMDRGSVGERVINVEPLYGTLMPVAGKQAKRELTGFDIEADRLINAKQVPQQPAPDWVLRDTAIASPTDLYQGVDAVGIANEQWLSALVDIVSLANVDELPGQLVNVSGKALEDKMHGTWMITKAQNHMESYVVSKQGDRKFDSSLTISRNSPSTFQVRNASVPNVDDACVGSGEKWASSSQQVVLL